MKDRKAYNSTLRPVAKNKLGHKKQPPAQGKSIVDRLLGEGKVFKASKLSTAPRKKMRRLAKNNPGWWSWAIEVLWPSRPHYCEICGLGISEPHPINFSHLLERGAYRRYIRDARNVRIVCGEHHRQWHDQPKEELIAGKHRHQRAWEIMFTREQHLKDEANGV